MWFSGCAAPGRSVARTEMKSVSPAQALRVFDRVDALVQTRHFSRQFNGADWPALRNHYRPLVAAAADDAEVYRLVNEMLAALHDSHTYAHSPTHQVVMSLPEERSAGTPSSTGHESRVLRGGVLYVRFDHFDAASARWLQQQISMYHDAPGFVIDLRRNNGGLITAGQKIVGSFFDRRVSMGIIVPRSGHTSMERSKFRRAPYLGPVVVLIGSHSYSSAEVFADVVQHYGRALVVGQESAGQVRGSRRFGLPGGGELQLSVSDYRRLDGRPLEGAGVVPDFSVEPSPDDFDLEVDPSVAAALRALGSD